MLDVQRQVIDTFIVREHQCLQVESMRLALLFLGREAAPAPRSPLEAGEPHPADPMMVMERRMSRAAPA